MGLVVVGAAGRMGQALIRAIHSIPGRRASPPRSSAKARRMIGQDAGELAGVGTLGVANHRRSRCPPSPRPTACSTSPRLPRPSSSPATPRRRASCTSSARPAAPPRTTQRSPPPPATPPSSKSGNMSLGVNLLAVLVEQAAKALGPEDFDIEVAGDASQAQGRRAVRHRAAARPRPLQTAARSGSTKTACGCATAIPARGRQGRSASPRCAAVPGHRAPPRHYFAVTRRPLQRPGQQQRVPDGASTLCL